MGVPSAFRRAFREFVDPPDTDPPEVSVEQHSFGLARPPPTADWRNGEVLSPVRFQGNCNTCTSFAASAVVEAVHRLSARQAVSLAPGFIHRCLLQRDCRTGATPKEVLRAVAAAGIAHAFQGDDPFPLERCATAELFSLSAWEWVAGVDSILAHVATTGPVLADMFIGESFLSLKPAQIYQVKPGEDVILHSVAVVGYDRGAGWAVVQNSFGSGWCKDGFGRIAIGSGNFLSGRGAFRISA